MNELHTSRLLLHPVSEWEAEALVAGIENPAYPWIEGYPHADTTDAIRHFLELNHIHGDLKGFGIWQIIRQSDRCIIGDIGFYGPPDVEGNVTVGFGLAVSARGQRFATEALFALLEWVLHQPGVRHVCAHTATSNMASRHVLETAGMVLIRQDNGMLHFSTP